MFLSQWNSDPDVASEYTQDVAHDASPKTRDGLSSQRESRRASAVSGVTPDIGPGDVVRVEEGIGVVRYMGQVRFAKGLWAGVELVEKMGMHDGQVGGKRYFRCKPKHGIFVDVANVQKKILPEKLLERVTLLNTEVLELRSENDKLSSKVRMLEAKVAAGSGSTPIGDGNSQGINIDDLEIGDRVKLANRKTGTVKFIGRVRGENDTFIGMEMHSWISNGNDGTKSGRRYFNVRPGWGYFARKRQIIEIIQKNSQQAPVRINLVLGDRVEIDRNRRGVVKFIGHVAFSKDQMVGLELDTWASYAHDGTKGGKRYFKAQHGKGYFCKIENVLRVLKSEDGSDDDDDEDDSTRQTRGGPFTRSPRARYASAHSPRNRSPRRSPSPRRFTPSASPKNRPSRLDPQNRDRDSDGEDDLGPSLENTEEAQQFVKRRKNSFSDLAVGDKIRLTRGKVGRVKYIGKVEFASGEVIGMELSAWTERGHDGSVMGKRYFECASGRGYFTKRTNISEIMSRGAGQQKKPESKANDPKEDLQVGDRVRLKRGKMGVIKFMGRVNGINRECVIGLELNQIGEERGHDGCSPLDGTRIFDCRPGHGYWTSKEAIVEVLSKKRSKNKGRGRHRRDGTDMVGMVPEYIKKLVDFRIGDTVRLSRGKEGIVRYIGPVDGMKREDIVGLELKVWTERGHDGSYKGKEYFSCPQGRGYFTSRDAVAEVLEHAADKAEKPPIRKMVSGENLPDDGGPSQLLEVEKGERVRLRNGRTGTVWFIGKTDFAKGEVVGMELDQWTPKGHDGSVKGQQYFNCPAGHGYFTRRAAIVEKLGESRRRRTPASSPRRRPRNEPRKESMQEEESSMSDDRPKALKIKVGDKVALKRGKRGIVRYIGPVEGASQDVVGLELEQWFERGNDGSFKGRRYFETRGDGWGYFTKPSSVAAIIHDEDEP